MREAEERLKAIPQFCFPDAKDWLPVSEYNRYILWCSSASQCWCSASGATAGLPMPNYGSSSLSLGHFRLKQLYLIFLGSLLFFFPILPSSPSCVAERKRSEGSSPCWIQKCKWEYLKWTLKRTLPTTCSLMYPRMLTWCCMAPLLSSYAYIWMNIYEERVKEGRASLPFSSSFKRNLKNLFLFFPESVNLNLLVWWYSSNRRGREKKYPKIWNVF